MAKSGNYWFNFKDRHNEKNMAPSYGIIHSTNMCTEISIPNTPDSTATCTLASINLSRFLKNEKSNDMDKLSFDEKLENIKWDDMKETIQIATRALDNVIELNYYVSEPSKKNSFDLRPLGLGVMWFWEMLLRLQIAYEDDDAKKLADTLGKFIYETALETSVQLGKERGTFDDYSADRYEYRPRRNILLLAIAPTATISNIAGTSSGIETYFSNVFARETVSGKFTIIAKALVDELRAKGMWNDDIRQQILTHQGSVQNIQALDWVINKKVYKTTYECPTRSQIDVAAAWQEHIDQAISRSLYMQEEERNNLDEIYLHAWKAGLKSTYYCFIEKNIQGEKYTESVNKRWARRWFGGVVGGNIDSQNAGENTAGQKSDYRSFDLENITDDQMKIMEEQMRKEKWDEYVEKLKAWTLYEWSCPTDPFEKVMCEGCQ